MTQSICIHEVIRMQRMHDGAIFEARVHFVFMDVYALYSEIQWLLKNSYCDNPVESNT